MYNTVTDIIQSLKNKFPFFGINKTRELSRLVFEISKIAEISDIEIKEQAVEDIIHDIYKNGL